MTGPGASGREGAVQRSVPFSDAIVAKYPEPVALAVSVDGRGRVDVIALGWTMMTSFEPPMFAISVGRTRYSHETIPACGAFVLAFPCREMADAVLYCGTHSGRDVDKLAETGLRAQPALEVAPPLLADAVANFECRLEGSFETGDHTIFAGRVVASHRHEEDRPRLYTVGPNYAFGTFR